MKKSLYYFFINILILVLARHLLPFFPSSLLRLSQVCAVCAPTCVNIRRPVEQVVGIQSRSCNHVSAPEWNHKSGRGWLRSAFAHTASIVRVCVHSVCFSSCAKYCLAGNRRSAVLTSRSVSCHFYFYYFFLYYNIT